MSAARHWTRARICGCASALLLFFALLVVFKAKVIVWLLACFGLFIVATIVTRGRLQNAALTLVSITFVLCVLEGAGLYAEPKIVYEHGPGLIAPRAVLGWGPAHAGAYRDRKTVDGHVAYDVTYTIDDDLFRVVDAGRNGPAVAFLGDSFMFGTGLDDRDTLPQAFANLEGRRLPVTNLGIAAFSPAQVLATMRTGLSDALLSRAELLVEFVAPWHAERVACKVDWVKNAPRYRLVGGALREDATCPAPLRSVLEKSHFYKTFVMPRLGANAATDFALLTAIASETARLARDKYHLPIVIYYLSDPKQFKGTDWSDARIVAALEAAGARVLPYNIPDEDKAPYVIVGDSHPTGLANTIHADRLAAYVAKALPDLAAAKALREERADNARP